MKLLQKFTYVHVKGNDNIAEIIGYQKCAEGLMYRVSFAHSRTSTLVWADDVTPCALQGEAGSSDRRQDFE